jgi:RimJ/RimL family protein N-acetyltransferase
MVKELGVSLREWKIDDAPLLAEAINNKKVLDNLRDGIQYPYTEKDAEEFIGAMLSADKTTTYAFAITYDGKVVGGIGAFRKDNVHRLTAEIGYYVAEPYWGKGIMSEAIRQICAFIFENTDIVRVFAEPYASNTASCRVLEKAGFQFEGVLRQNAIKNGQIMDMKIYSILKPPTIRTLIASDVIPAMELVWRVFSEFEAPDYSDEGIKEFKAFIEPTIITGKIESGEIRLLGAFDGVGIVGAIAIKPPLHIALLFVDKRYHRRGIARKLFETVLGDQLLVAGHDRVTVNSSPYAVEAYRRLGFVPTSEEQTVNGLRFTPMEKMREGRRSC